MQETRFLFDVSRLDNSTIECFHQHLHAQSVSTTLFDLLGSSEDQLEHKLLLLDRSSINKLANNLTQKSKQIFLLLLFGKLNSWHPKCITSEDKLASSLFDLMGSFQSSNTLKVEMIIYLMYNLKDVKLVYELLETKFISQHLDLSPLNINPQLKGHVRRFFINVSQQLVNQTASETMTLTIHPEDIPTLKIKTLKLYSRIIREDIPQQLQLNQIQNYKLLSSQLFREVLQIPIEQNQAIIQKLTNSTVAIEKGSIVLCLDKEIEPYRRFISDQTFIKIFGTCQQFIDFLAVLNIQGKEILRFNLIDYPEHVFANLVPYRLKDSISNNQTQLEAIFKNILTKSMDLIKKAMSDKQIQACSYIDGEVFLRSYQKPQKIRMIEVCLLLWQNVLKIMGWATNIKQKQCKNVIQEWLGKKVIESLFQELMHPNWFNLTIGNRLCSIESLLNLQANKILCQNNQLMSELIELLTVELNKPDNKNQDISSILELASKKYPYINECVQTHKNLINLPIIFEQAYMFDTSLQLPSSYRLEDRSFRGIGTIGMELAELVPGQIERGSSPCFDEFVQTNIASFLSSFQLKSGVYATPLQISQIKLLCKIFTAKILFEHPTSEALKQLIYKILEGQPGVLLSLDRKVREKIIQTLQISKKDRIRELILKITKNGSAFYLQFKYELVGLFCSTSMIELKNNFQELIIMLKSNSEPFMQSQQPCIIQLLEYLLQVKIHIRRQLDAFFIARGIDSLQLFEQKAKFIKKQTGFNLNQEIKSFQRLIGKVLRHISRLISLDRPEKVMWTICNMRPLVMKALKGDLVDKISLVRLLLDLFREQSTSRCVNRINFAFLCEYQQQIFLLLQESAACFNTKNRRQQLQIDKEKLLKLDYSCLYINLKRATTDNLQELYRKHLQVQLLMMVQKFLPSISTLASGKIQKVYFNGIIFQGSDNLLCLQATVIKVFLSEAINKYKSLLVPLYKDALSKMSISRCNLEIMRNKASKETKIYLPFPFKEMPMVKQERKALNEFLLRSHIKFVSFLIHYKEIDKDIDNSSTIYDIAQQFLTDILQKIKYIKQFTDTLKFLVAQVELTLEREIPDLKAYNRNFNFINLYIRLKLPFHAEQVFSLSFIRCFITNLRSMLQMPSEFEQQICLSLPMLAQLLPSSYGLGDRQKLHCFAGLIMKMIITIVRKWRDRLTPAIFQRIATKLLADSSKQLKVYLLELIQWDIESRIADIICQDLRQETYEVRIEQHIKSYFFEIGSAGHRRDSDSIIRVDFNEFFLRFRHKYENQAVHFSKTAASMLYRSADAKNLQICYQIDTPFQYSKFLRKDFIDFKPPLLLRRYLRKMMSSFGQTSSIGPDECKILTAIIFNSPIVLAYIAFHPIPGYKKWFFLDFVVQKTVRSAMSRNDLKELLLLMCMDTNSMVGLKGKTYFLADYICYQVVKRLDQLQCQDLSFLLIVAHLSQIKRFARLCYLRPTPRTPSLQDKVQRMFKSLLLAEKGQGVWRYLCSVILSILQRSYSYQRLPSYCRDCINKDDWDSRSRKSKLLVKGLQVSQEQSEAITHSKLLNLEDSISCDELQHLDIYLLEKMQGQYEQVTIQLDLFIIEDLVLDDDILESFRGMELCQLKKYDVNRQFRSIIQNEYSSLLQDIKQLISNKICKTISKTRIIFKERFTESLEGIVEENQFLWQKYIRVSTNSPDSSNYAPKDRSYGFVPTQYYHCNQSQSFHQILWLALQELSTNKNNLQVPTQIHMKPCQSLENDEEIKMLVSSINQNRHKSSNQPFSLQSLPMQSRQDTLKTLKDLLLQSQFYLKETTLSREQFEEYCLSNLTPLSRLGSQVQQKIGRIEQEMLLTYVIRATCQDGIDYIIDTIDQNYQLLSEAEAGKCKVDRNNQQYKSEKCFLRELRVAPGCLQLFPQVDEETLLRFIEMVYLPESKWIWTWYIPLLENKRVQTKIVNTLLYIYRNPYQNSIYTSRKISDLSPLPADQKELEKEKNSVRHVIIQIISSVYCYSFYRDEQYLLEENDGKGLGDIVLTPLQQLCAEPQYNQQNIYEVILYVFDKRTEGIYTEVKCKMLRKLTKVPEVLIQPIFDFLFYSIGDEFVHDLGHQIKSCKIEQNLKDICKIKDLQKIIAERIPSSEIHLELTFIAASINFGIYQKHELENIHKDILQKQEEGLKNNQILFLNKVLSIYSDQEIQQSLWLQKHSHIYFKVIKTLTQETGLLGWEDYFRLLRMPTFLHSITPGQKVELFLLQMEWMIKQKGLVELSPTIYAKRGQGIFFSAFQQLRYKPNEFWICDFSVQFVNENNTIETGFGRGVQKDWYDLITKEMVHLQQGLFMRSSKNYYFFNRESWINPRHLQFFEFIGKLFALSFIKKGYFLSPSFSLVVYKMILGEAVSVDDLLEEFDQGQVLRNLYKLRQFTDNSMFWQTFIYEDVGLICDKQIQIIKQNPPEGENLCLFQEAIKIKSKKLQQAQTEKILKVLKVCETTQLIPGGAEIPVTLANLEDYIQLTKNKIYQKVIGSIKLQFRAFLQGLESLIDVSYLKRFSADQLRNLAEGSNHISLELIKENVQYNGYRQDNKIIQIFWDVLGELDPDDLSYFIQHWTGSPKLPQESLSLLQLTITRMNKSDCRIFAQTCFNELRLPGLQTKEKMYEAVMSAVNSVKLGLSIVEDK